MAATGFPLESSQGKSDYFNSIQVEYFGGLANFIGVSFSRDFHARYRGVNVFDVQAKTLFDTIAAGEASGPHIFNEYEHIFPDQIMALWDADSQYDRLGAESRVVWAQVGIGNSTYLKLIAEVRG